MRVVKNGRRSDICDGEDEAFGEELWGDMNVFIGIVIDVENY